MKHAALVPLLAAGTLLALDLPAPVVVTKENAFTFYRTFKRLTKQPHLVAPLTAALCTTPRPEVVEREKNATGPHYQNSIHLYANALAEESITRRLLAFPEGAVIVKEKLNGQEGADGVGGMIKRAPGYDPSNGDWEYFYADGATGFSTGKLQNCITCHAQARATDYVYSVWNL